MLYGAFDPAFLPIDDESGHSAEHLAATDRASHLAALAVVAGWVATVAILCTL